MLRFFLIRHGGRRFPFLFPATRLFRSAPGAPHAPASAAACGLFLGYGATGAATPGSAAASRLVRRLGHAQPGAGNQTRHPKASQHLFEFPAIHLRLLCR